MDPAFEPCKIYPENVCHKGLPSDGSAVADEVQADAASDVGGDDPRDPPYKSGVAPSAVCELLTGDFMNVGYLQATDSMTESALVGGVVGCIQAGAMTFCKDVATTDDDRKKLINALLTAGGGAAGLAGPGIGLGAATLAQGLGLALEHFYKTRDYRPSVEAMFGHLSMEFARLFGQAPAASQVELAALQTRMRQWMADANTALPL